MTGPQAPASIQRAYRLTRYHVAGIVVRIGHAPKPHKAGRAPGCQRSPQSTIVLIGAANPCGRKYPDAWNNRMTQRLIQAAGHLPIALGEGRLGQWHEPFVAIEIPLPRAITLARRFRQNAVVVLSGTRPARLVWLR